MYLRRKNKVVFHEAGHAVIARQLGIGVHRAAVVLAYDVGKVDTEGDPKFVTRWREHTKVSLAGPLAVPLAGSCRRGL
jgi:Zn-dependent protease